MTHTYRFRILKNPNPQDLREFPAYAVCEGMLNDLLGLSDTEKADLRAGNWISRDLWDNEVVKFHHERRKCGCCPRIKWDAG